MEIYYPHKEMTKKEFNEAIERHKRWLLGEEDGVPADISWQSIKWIDLSGANLSGANIRRTNLKDSDLSGANLSGATLQWANLNGANLKGAKLNGANLNGAYLRESDLRGADLREADIVGIDLRGANLEGTILNKYMYQTTVCENANITTTYDALNNQVIWGCWICIDGNTLENFEKKIESVYGENGETPNEKYYHKYIGVINFFKAMEKL